jgi:hypothetical protein
LLVSACSQAPAAAPISYRPSEVKEVASLPLGYEKGAALSAACSVASRTSFDDAALDDVDCNFARLSRVLRARAGVLSARLIFDKRCHARSGAGTRLECSAKIARPTQHVSLAAKATDDDRGPAPSAAQVQDLDEPRPQDAAEIRVAFAPSATPAVPRAPRSYDAVAETRLPSVGRRELGRLSARCEGCDLSALHHALRVAGGHVGAGEVTSVSCFQDDGSLRCIATALEPWSS